MLVRLLSTCRVLAACLVICLITCVVICLGGSAASAETRNDWRKSSPT